MSQESKTETLLVLRISSLRESDLLVHCLSPSLGLLTTSIRRGRYISTLAGFPYQPGDFIEVVYKFLENKDFVSILSHSPYIWRKRTVVSYKQFVFETYILELLFLTSQPNQENQKLFTILLQFATIETTIEIRLWFFLWLIVKENGLQFNYHICHSCNKATFIPFENNIKVRKASYILQNKQGSLLCSDCFPNETQINSASIKLFWLSDQSIDLKKTSEIPKELLLQNTSILCNYIHIILEINPRSATSLRQFIPI